MGSGLLTSQHSSHNSFVEAAGTDDVVWYNTIYRCCVLTSICHHYSYHFMRLLAGLHTVFISLDIIFVFTKVLV